MTKALTLQTLMRFAMRLGNPTVQTVIFNEGAGKRMMTKAKQVDEVGFYVEHFTPAEMSDLEAALGDSLRGEIGMLRVIMRRFFERAADEEDDFQVLANSLRVLGMSCTRLAKVIQTERNLQDKRADELGEALSRSMAAVLEEMGSLGLNGKQEGGHHGR